MFKNICIIPNDLSYPTDMGFIAENLLYYEKVNIVSGTKTLPVLINNCGIETLIELLTNRNLKILMRENLLAVSMHQSHYGELRDIMLISSPSLTKEEMIFRGIFDSTGRRGYSKRMTQKLLPYIDTISYENNISELIKDDLQDNLYIKQTIIDTIRFYNPELTLRAEEIEYAFNKIGDKYLFESNLNYEKINKQIPNNPGGQIINPTSILLNIAETRGDMHLCSSLDSEIATTAIHSSLMKIKFHDIYKRTITSSENLYQFNDFILSDGHAIRETINNGDKNFDEFFKVLDKADKFKDWLKNIDDDKNIIKEYYTAVSKETLIDKLPAKSFRWSFFTGAGLLTDMVATGGIGTAIGLGLSLGDAFLLDKVLKGWKPNVFIDNHLKKIIN